MTKKNKDIDTGVQSDTREIKILLPTTKIKKSVKCETTAQAYKIFRDILDFEAVELRDTEHFRSAPALLYRRNRRVDNGC